MLEANPRVNREWVRERTCQYGRIQLDHLKCKENIAFLDHVRHVLDKPFMGLIGLERYGL